MIETSNFWVELEIAFARIWGGEDANSDLKALSEKIMSQVVGGEYEEEYIDLPEEVVEEYVDEETEEEEDNSVQPRPMISFGGSAPQEEQDASRYGTASNHEALEKNLSKLILSVEMENWEKAEMFMETIRQLTADAPQEVSRAVLRLKMAIQKENYDKISTGLETLKALIDEEP